MTCKPAALVLNLMSLVALGFAQQDRQTPNVDVTFPNTAVSVRAANNVCNIDFRNARMIDAYGEHSAKLTNGKYERRWKDEGSAVFASTILDGLYCFDAGDTDGKYAIVALEWVDCGGSCSSTGVVQLFRMQAGKPVVVQQFSHDSHAEGTGVTFDKRTRALRIITNG